MIFVVSGVVCPPTLFITFCSCAGSVRVFVVHHCLLANICPNYTFRLSFAIVNIAWLGVVIIVVMQLNSTGKHPAAELYVTCVYHFFFFTNSSLTFASHVRFQAFGKTACLTLIPSRYIDYAFATFLTCVLQIPVSVVVFFIVASKKRNMQIALPLHTGLAPHRTNAIEIHLPSYAAFEEPPTTVARCYTIMLSGCSVAAYLTVCPWSM